MRSLKLYSEKGWRIDIEQKRLNLYLIDMKYIRNLAKADDHVMSVTTTNVQNKIIDIKSILKR